MWHPDPEITALMNEACRMIPIKDAAIPLLDRIIQLQPEYYEVRLHCWLLHGIQMLKVSGTSLQLCVAVFLLSSIGHSHWWVLILIKYTDFSMTVWCTILVKKPK